MQYIYIFFTVADQLIGMLNSSLNVSETETIFASRGIPTLSSPACEATGCPLLRSHSHPQQSVTKMIQPICHYLTSHLSQLSQLLVNIAVIYFTDYVSKLKSKIYLEFNVL